MKNKAPFYGLALMVLIYVVVLFWLDSRNNVFLGIYESAHLLVYIVLLSACSYIIRFCRWNWLLKKAGHRFDFGRGLLGYLAGFTFTSTPGKVGELLRIRYFSVLAVPSWLVVSAFIYERMLDLVVILILCSFSLVAFQGRIQVLSFVVFIVLGIVFMVREPMLLDRVMNMFRFNKFFSDLVTVFKSGVLGIGLWSKWSDFFISLILGLLAWTITSFSFVLLLDSLNIEMPIVLAISIYPLAMLVGAASMLPGGLGSTEAAIVFLLTANQVQFDTAVLASIIIRLGTLWFATICGVFSMLYLDTLITSRKV
jgi:uncharacterized protein (TIRG00374 family)